MNWTEYLDHEVRYRLAQCCSRKSDLSLLVNARWTYMLNQGMDKQGFTKEDALIAILELLDENGQDIGYSLTVTEYNDLIH